MSKPFSLPPSVGWVPPSATTATSEALGEDVGWGPPTLLSTSNKDGNPNEGGGGGSLHLPGNLSKFMALPYAPFGRSDRLGRAADFTMASPPPGGVGGGGGGGQGQSFSRFQSSWGGGDGQQQQQRSSGGYQRGEYNRDHRGPGGGGGFQQNRGSGAWSYSGGPSSFQQGGGGGAEEGGGGDAEEGGAGGGGGAFQLVDTAKAGAASGGASKRFVNPNLKRRQHSQRLRQINARRQASTGGANSAPLAMDRMTMARRGGGGGGGRGGMGGGRGGPGGGGRGYGGRGGGGSAGAFGGRVDRQPSVAVQNDWVSVDEIDLGKINKSLHPAMMTVPTPSDVLWCGFLDPYNDVFDKVTARQPVPLKRVETKEFYPVTTTDDPVLEKLAIDGAGQVFVTDAILAHLMTCTRSVYPWDVVVQKLPNGTLFFDKRDNSQFDFLTVHETAYHPPPAADADDDLNAPERLALEATIINQNFSQQILKKTGRKSMDLPNPFFDEDDHEDNMEPASVAFRYRSFELDPGTTVVCRTELHGIVKSTQYMTAFALNEYMPASGGMHQQASWRDKIDSQRGAVLATELKNNSFKLAKWTAQSLLAGADQMKIGFVSRAHPKNSYEHVILATQFYRPPDFASQITLREGHMWALFRYFVHLFQKQPQGKYVLMRDPNHASLKIYKVPPETFEDDE